MTTSRYATEWAAAIERTKRFGLEAPKCQMHPRRRYLTSKHMEELPRIVSEEFGNLEMSNVNAQCVAMSYRFAPVVRDWLGCPAIFTLGWIDNGTAEGMFKFDETLIADILKNGCAHDALSVHAWITLPSAELIDLTIATTAVKKNHPDGYMYVLAKHADELVGIEYKPMLVGDGIPPILLHYSMSPLFS